MSRERLIALSTRVYHALLILYPKPFREAYGELMLQLFRDQLREASAGNQSMVRLWFAGWADLVANAGAERLRQVTRRQWIFAALRSVGGLAALLSSLVALIWIVLMITVIWLIAWDVGNPPAGTFAESVNNFFETGKAYLPSLIVLLCEIIAFSRRALSGHYPLTTLSWRFAGLNAVSMIISTAVAVAGMVVSRVLFPNHDPWEGDQSYGVALVYWGLVVTGSLIAYFARLAWAAPSKLPLARCRKPTTTDTANGAFN